MKTIFMAGLTAVILSISTATVVGEVVDKIAVVVNSEVITQGEIDRIIAPAYEQFRRVYTGEELIRKLDEARQAVISQLIEEKLVLSEARKQNIEVDEKDVDAKVAEARKRFSNNAMFEEALSKQHLTLKELRNKFKEQLMGRKLIDKKIGVRIAITPAEVIDYYNGHIADFTQPEQIAISNILIKPKENLPEENVLALVSDISKRLKAGESFSDLAKAHSEGPGASEGGSMGYVKKGDLLPEIESVVFDMKEGEISQMVRTKIGYHFFRIDEKKAPQVVSIDEARKSIEEILWMAKMRDRSKDWLEDLRKHAYIAFK